MRIAGIDQPPGVSFAIPVEPDRLRELRRQHPAAQGPVTPKTATFRIIAEDKSSFERDSYIANFHARENM